MRILRARLSKSSRATRWRSPLSIRLEIAAAWEQSPSVTLLRDLTLGVRRNPLVDPIGVVGTGSGQYARKIHRVVITKQ